MIKFTDMLREEPQIITNLKVNEDYIDHNLRIPINKSISGNGFMKTDDEQVVMIPTMFGGIFIYLDGNIIVAATNLEKTKLYGKTFLTPIITKKFEVKYSNVLHKLYKVASKHFDDIPVISDERQTLDSSSIWKSGFLILKNTI